MEPSELLARLAASLERLGLRYFVTGAMATIYYGEPRFTNDIDVVIELPMDKVAAFCEEFPADEFYCSAEAARDAVARHLQFNVIHPTSGLKIDVMIPSDTDFNRSRLARRVRQPLDPGVDVWFATPEDVILKKLAFYEEGGSDKHIRDILGILKVRGSQLDRDYVQGWSERLGLARLWQDLETRAAL